MSKPTIDSPPTPAPAPVYNPLSMLAILGLGCGGLYAGIVLMSTLVALTSGAPLFLPDLLLVLPIVGAGLSLLAFRQIQNSEGTLSGETIARWGLWLSILAGLGYGAYYLSTGIAIQQQANTFLMTKGDDGGFFEVLQEGDLNRAFLMTLPYNERKSINPNDPKSMSRYEQAIDDKTPRGRLHAFADHFIVQLVMQAGHEKKPVQSLGAKSWKYDQGEYEVERNYRIETEELTLDVVMTLKSNDGVAPGESRKWTVLWNTVKPLDQAKFTPLGVKLRDLRMHAAIFFGNWAEKLGQGKLAEPYPQHKTDWDRDHLKVGDSKQQKKIRNELNELFTGKDKSKRMIKPVDQGFVPWKMENGHMQLYFSFITSVPGQPAPAEIPVLVEVRVVVEATEKGQPLDLPRDPSWRIASFEAMAIRDVPSPSAKKAG